MRAQRGGCLNAGPKRRMPECGPKEEDAEHGPKEEDA